MSALSSLWEFIGYIALFIFSIVGLYIGSRVVSAGYFKSRREYEQKQPEVESRNGS